MCNACFVAGRFVLPGGPPAPKHWLFLKNNLYLRICNTEIKEPSGENEIRNTQKFKRISLSSG